MNEPLPPSAPPMAEGLTVVVPCYNAGDRLAPVVEAIARHTAHLLVVDDGSTDGAPGALPENPARVIRLPENRGKGDALLAGFAVALERPETVCVGVVDADGQHDPDELPGLYAAFHREAADLLIGSRQLAGADVPWPSRIGNAFTAWLTARILGRRLPDTQSGYRLHSRRFLEDALRDVPGGRYETEMELVVMAVRRGYRVVPAPIATRYEAGNPSSHFRRITDSVRVIARLVSAARKHRPGG